jgi:hypothetical protein
MAETYTLHVTLDAPLDTADEQVRAALKEEGFGVLTEIDVESTLREKLGVTERLIVIGGDAAGMSRASQARRLKGPDELEILAFERGRFTSYAACGIPYWIAGT